MQINYRVATYALGDTWRFVEIVISMCFTDATHVYTYVHANVDQAVAAGIARDASRSER